MPSTPARTQPEPEPSAFDRVLAITAVAAVGLSLVGFVVSLLHMWLRLSVSWLDGPPWSLAFLVPMFALPLGFLCVLALLVISAVRKSRHARRD